LIAGRGVSPGLAITTNLSWVQELFAKTATNNLPLAMLALVLLFLLEVTLKSQQLVLIGFLIIF
jgi:hypothetical protein